MFTKIEFKKYVHKVVGGPEVDLWHLFYDDGMLKST